jgi:preprotein translocase subunit Sec61beta
MSINDEYKKVEDKFHEKTDEVAKKAGIDPDLVKFLVVIAAVVILVKIFG